MFVASWKLAFASKRRRSEPFASHVSQCRRMGYAPPFTYRTTHRGSGGHHGEGSDAQQQRKEEAEAGQKQEERRRSLTVRRHAQPGQTRHLVHEPIRQEALAGDHCARHHLRTSSTVARNVCGIVRPRAAAVLALMANSNLVGCSTGISPGLVPRRILSTISAAFRNRSA